MLVQCSFSQQIWHDIMSKQNLLSCMPLVDENFNTWFASAATGASPALQKGVKSVILLTIWLLRKTRNEVIFKELTPNRQDLVVSILEEAKLWILAGAKELRRLPLHSRPLDGMLN
jgi:hypothetical protein